MPGRRRLCLFLTAVAGCAPAPSSPPPPREEIFLGADAPGTAARPAEVVLALKRGALHLGPGRANGHLVEGTIHSDDLTLLPHVTMNARGVAVVQDFAPDAGATGKIAWDLTLGRTPMRLSVHVLGSEDQEVDLGGRAIAWARLHNEGGHLKVDWSAPNPIAAEAIELWSIGYLEARHAGRAGARRIQVKSLGRGEIDLGDRVDRELRIEVEGEMGSLAITVPRSVAARAELESPAGVRLEAEGWSHESASVHVQGPRGASPKVVIAVRSASGALALRVRE